MNLASKEIVTIEVIENSLPTCARFHPKRDTLAAVGHLDGKVSFVDVKSLKTYTLETSEDPLNSVTDINFDPGEDHLLVALKDGSLVMIAFESLDSST